MVYGLPPFGLPYRALVLGGDAIIVGIASSQLSGNRYAEKTEKLQAMEPAAFAKLIIDGKSAGNFLMKVSKNDMYSVPPGVFVMTWTKQGMLTARWPFFPEKRWRDDFIYAFASH